MRTLALSLVVGLFALAAPATAQDCTLTADFDGTAVDGGTWTIAVDGAAPGSPVFLFVSQTLGSTCVSAPTLEDFCLGVAAPLILLPIGSADATGSLEVSAAVPGDPGGTLAGVTAHLQSVALEFTTPGSEIGTCVTNVASVTID